MSKKAWPTAPMCSFDVTVSAERLESLYERPFRALSLSAKTCHILRGGKEDVVSVDGDGAAVSEGPPDLLQGRTVLTPCPVILHLPNPLLSHFTHSPTLNLPTPLAFAPLLAAVASACPTDLSLKCFNVASTFGVVLTPAFDLDGGFCGSLCQIFVYTRLTIAILFVEHFINSHLSTFV
ncbi:hypothetical protein SprV_0200679600 [Sparganum proliferum]